VPGGCGAPTGLQHPRNGLKHGAQAGRRTKVGGNWPTRRELGAVARAAVSPKGNRRYGARNGKRYVPSVSVGIKPPDCSIPLCSAGSPS
jgi:hypothetical protein